MADQEPAGRGQGDGKGSKKLKFAPTVPSRRKKSEVGAAGPSAAEAAAANEAFQDLIHAAQSESKWERGRGRGFGRGRGGMGAQHVTFGGGDDNGRRPTSVAPPPPRLPGLRQLPASSSAAAAAAAVAAGATKSDLRAKLKSDPTKADGSKHLTHYDIADDADADEFGDDRSSGKRFDFSQYYPTSLPLSLHHPDDDAADASADAALMRQGVPQDLVMQQDDPEASALHLGLTDLSAAQDYLYLFQLPAALPLAAAAAQGQDQTDQRGGRRLAAANGSSSAALGLQRAAGIKELPSSKIGKLLIFQSGKVKLQMGDVLLDVTAGVPCVTRQEVAAINSSAKMLVNLGPVTQRAVVCPDVWQLMSDQEVPHWQRTAAVKQRQRLGGAAEAAAEHAEMHAAAAANGKGLAAADGDADDMELDSDSKREQGASENSEDSMSEDLDEQMTDQTVAPKTTDCSGGDRGKDNAEAGSRQDSPAAAAEPELATVAAAAAAVDEDVLGLLGIPPSRSASPAAAAISRGKGRFRPAAGRTVRGAKKADGRNVDR